MTETSDKTLTHITEQDRYSCCSGSLIGTSEAGDMIKIIPLFCHKWTCPRCNKQKSAFWREIACSGDPERFVTLTVRAQDGVSPKLQAINMKTAFAKLVQKIRYRFGSFEYLLVFELTKKGTPHVHILSRGNFIPQNWLSTEWKKLTGSFIVDIRKIKRKTDIANYITKYLGKAISRVAEELHGLRIIQKSRAWDLRPDEEKQKDRSTDLSEVQAFAFCFCAPKKVYEYLTTVHGFLLDKEGSSTCWTLRGPPVEDLESDVLWKLVQEKGFREARG